MSWREEAACKGKPTSLFYPEKFDSKFAAAAKAICASCPVQAPCRHEGLVGHELGIWGGLSFVDRKRTRSGERKIPRLERVETRLCRDCRREFQGVVGRMLCDDCRAEARRQSVHLAYLRRSEAS